MNRIAKLMMCLLIVLSLAVSLAVAEEGADAAIVTVNGEAIYQSELDSVKQDILNSLSEDGYDTEDESILSTAEEAALQQLIDDLLIVQDMTQKGCYELTEEEEAQLCELGETAYQAMLQQYVAYYLQDMEEQAVAIEELKEMLLTEGYSAEIYYQYYRNCLASARYEELLVGDVQEEDEDAYYELVDAKLSECLEALTAQAEIVYLQ